ncbi:zinc finger, CCHC-type containing protein [Tanacetum coccineum]
MDSIMGNNTWVLADLPPGCKPLGCKWIFKRKRKVDGTIEKFKARLVIQGFKQKSRIYYFDTYAPVARIGTIRLQAPKQWHQKFDEVVLSNGCLLNQVDKCVYSKFDETGKGVIIFLYVEIFGTDQVQSYYIEKVLKKFNYFDCTPVSTPMDTSEKLMPNNGQAVSQLEYSRVIGCLMYAMTCTRPDISFVVGKLSRYTSNPGTQHWQAIQWVLKYLKKTMDYRLAYTGYPSVLEGYTNASWISNTDDNSSTSGWVFLLAAAAGKEAEWLKNLLLEIPLWSKPIAPIYIRCDSTATLAKAYSQMYNGKSRHLGVRHSMIRELITNGVVSIEFVRSQQNLADHLTKGLARDLVIKSAEGMGLNTCIYISSQGCAWNLLIKEDEVVNFSMVNFFEKVLSRSMNKEEPPISYWVMGLKVRSVLPLVTEHPDSDSGERNSGEAEGYHQGVIHQIIYPQLVNSSKLWGSLKAKYMAEDASSKKFLVSNFTNYNMTNSRPVMEQYNELLDFKHTLKNQKGLTLVELGSHLRIKESLRAQDNDKPKGNNVAGPLVVNMVDHNNSSRYNDNIGKRKHQDTKRYSNKKSKVTCWKCGKPGHLKKDCKGGKGGNKANGLGTNSLVDGSTNSLKGQNMFNKSLQVYYVTYVSEAYYVQDDDVAWTESRVLRGAIFNENRFSLVSRPNLRIPNGTEEIGGSVVLEEKEAINEEMDSILANNTWVLANLPPCCKPLHCKWIYQRKLKVDGTIEKFKARLVIQGFRKKSRIYYFDTYALVARISTIRLLIDLVPIHNLIIHQMDVNIAFLNGKLDEEFYMNQSYGFIMLGNENKVLYEGNGECCYRGIWIKHESNGIAISQSHYIEKTEAHIFTIIPSMCLEPAEKEDEDFTSQWLISLKMCLAGP